jgi:RNA polymerase sigma-70 factor (ECF subfamily)
VVIDWGELYRTVLPDLVRFLHRKVWDMERARDLAQDAFVRALRESPDNPRAWLFTVAANLAKDEARTAIRRKGHLTLLKTEAEGSAVTADPSVELERGEREAVVRRALEALGERDREALLLWDAGLDYGEIAGALEISTGSVGTTLARARDRLVKAHREQEQSDVAHQ